MAWEDFKFTPEDGLSNTTTFPSKPASGAAARAQPMTLFNQIKTFFNGTVKNTIDEHKADNVNSKEVHGLRIESGTWTPVLKGTSTAGNHTYTTKAGIYYKIGKFVFIRFEIVISALDSSMAGIVVVDGLPFVNVSGGTGAIARLGNITLPTGNMLMLNGPAFSPIKLEKSNPANGATPGNVLVSEVGNLTLVGTMSYTN